MQKWERIHKYKICYKFDYIGILSYSINVGGMHIKEVYFNTWEWKILKKLIKNKLF